MTLSGTPAFGSLSPVLEDRGEEVSAEAAVLAALDAVIDPELDEPITELRFVRSLTVTSDGDVSVSLRLPTPQCAPNFAFLMASDARRAVRRLPWVRRVSVDLDDHYTAGEITAALDRGEGFTGAFPGETADENLEALRDLFTRKALIARQTKVCERMLADGMDAEAVLACRAGDLPDMPEARRALDLRAQLGITATPDAPAFVHANGATVEAADLQRWLRMGRLTRTSLEANGGVCRSLLQFRHDLAPDYKEIAR